jgi:hypothetical protein
MQTRLLIHFRFSCDFVLLRDSILTHARLDTGLPTERHLNPYWCKGVEPREVIFDGDFIQVLQYKRSSDGVVPHHKECEGNLVASRD